MIGSAKSESTFFIDHIGKQNLNMIIVAFILSPFHFHITLHLLNTSSRHFVEPSHQHRVLPMMSCNFIAYIV